MKQYLIQVLIALDQFGTALVGGYADETLSSYAWRLEQKGKWAGRVWRPTIDWLALKLFGQADHCLMAYQEERIRAQLPPELR